MITTEKQVRDWFGNRGYPIPDDSKIKFKTIDHKENSFIFIHDSADEYDEVEMYYLNSSFCEPYDGWSRKGFSWAKPNLLKLIKESDNDTK